MEMMNGSTTVCASFSLYCFSYPGNVYSFTYRTLIIVLGISRRGEGLRVVFLKFLLFCTISSDIARSLMT